MGITELAFNTERELISTSSDTFRHLMRNSIVYVYFARQS